MMIFQRGWKRGSSTLRRRESDKDGEGHREERMEGKKKIKDNKGEWREIVLSSWRSAKRIFSCWNLSEWLETFRLEKAYLVY